MAVGNRIQDLDAAAALDGTELVEVVQSGGSARTTAADVGNAATNWVKLTGTQTVAGAKTFTGITRLQNGAAGGALIVGADVGASTTTDNARKLFQISQINYDNEGLPYCVLRSDSNSTAASTALDLGGTGTAAAHGFPNVRFWTAPDINQSAVLRWFFNAAGGFQPGASGSYDIGGPTARVRDFYGVGGNFSGSIGFGGNTTPTAAIDNNGFSKLGESAPKIKQKKLTGTTGAAGTTVTVAHGVTQSKILECAVIVNNSGGIGNIPHTGDPTTGNAYFSVFFDSTNVSVFVGAGGTQVASRPFRVLLTYEE